MNPGAQPPAESATGMTSPLTERESDILLMAALGYSDPLVARLMRVSVDAVENHRLELGRKLGIGSADGLAALLAGALQCRADPGAVPMNVDRQPGEDRRTA